MLRMKGHSVAEIRRMVNRNRLPGSGLRDLSRPTISQHLLVLQETRLVQCEFQGPRHIYKLDRRGFDELRKYLDNFEGIAGFPKAPDGLFLSQVL
jgi:DNA-binding transcriptional ArsR family regulator